MDNNFSSSSILSGFDLGPDNDSSARSGPPDVQLNWISRFLHIKPASKVLCFQLGRGKVRQELVRLLRDWQNFGVKDVTFDRQANTINARVAKNNREYTQLLFRAWSLHRQSSIHLNFDWIYQVLWRKVLLCRFELFS